MDDDMMIDVVISFLVAIQCIILQNNRKLAQIRKAICFNIRVLHYHQVHERDVDVLNFPREPYCKVRVHLLLDLLREPQQLKKHCRVTQASFLKLLTVIATESHHGWDEQIQLLTFLFWLACGSAYRVVSAATGIPRSSVCDIVHRVLKRVLRVMKTIVKLPQQNEIPAIAEGFRQLAHTDAINMAAGSIDGTHVKIMPPGSRREDYINRKLFYSVNMQALCDHRGVFLDVFVGYPGSVHDARVLKCSPLYRQQDYPPEGYYILGDTAYPCQTRPLALLTPYKAPASPVQGRYNYHLSRARTVIERAFGVMKTRWRSIFTKTLEVSPYLAPKVAAACAVMHNVCVLAGDEWGEELDEADNDHHRIMAAEPVGLDREHVSAEPLRRHIAAQISAPLERAHHLNEHDYI